MTKRNDMKQNLARLEHVLDTFGAEPRRWPRAERAGLEVLVKAQAPARRLLREAQALERVMEQAPTAGASDALKARIVAAAVNDGTREARVVPVAVARGGVWHLLPARRMATMWPAAALAASFAFGIYLGVSGIGGQTFDRAVQLASTAGGGADADAVYWLDEGVDTFTEDLL